MMKTVTARARKVTRKGDVKHILRQNKREEMPLRRATVHYKI